MKHLDLFSLHMRVTTLMIETQAVVVLRLMGMAGIIPAHHGENHLMVSEKGPAMAQAFTEASMAMMAGKQPDQVFSAAMDPISKRVKSNHKRLTR
ncbi:antifreeze protein [Sulfitobacter sp. JBTF-M27]|uniref:Antifreeze protein n=1 Tax=Sulfitobacter sediminilitoris TaxID=2698830 RepID=A0A6P0CCM3_9RHOB|nr:antifreeze protein [Sulfitobacter sediminilitoris]NEK22918.1 antifreeze protein [Sulfitobacter sediminilitoris]